MNKISVSVQIFVMSLVGLCEAVMTLLNEEEMHVIKKKT
jgi:hypothetical protein